MSDFSDSQIEEAKRRVRQMQNRASRYTSDSSMPKSVHKDELNNNSSPRNNSSMPFSIDNIFKSLGIGDNDENSKGSGLILALILVLSHEKADSMLILALLYILL